MAIYLTKDGDTLDYICWKFYGKEAGAVEYVLEANAGLSAFGPIYEAGMTIDLPDLPPAEDTETTLSLWD